MEIPNGAKAILPRGGLLPDGVVPFQLQLSPSEFSLGEALEYLLEKSMRSEGRRYSRVPRWKSRRVSGEVPEFRQYGCIFGDVCASHLIFAFKNRLAIQYRLLNRLAEVTKQEEPKVVPENNRMRMISR